MSLLFRFRSKERDIGTDISRVTPIHDLAQSALREAKKELGGLQARLPTPENETAHEEAGLSQRGRNRTRYLEAEIAALRQVKSLLDGVLQPETADSAWRWPQHKE